MQNCDLSPVEKPMKKHYVKFFKTFVPTVEELRKYSRFYLCSQGQWFLVYGDYKIYCPSQKNINTSIREELKKFVVEDCVVLANVTSRHDIKYSSPVFNQSRIGGKNVENIPDITYTKFWTYETVRDVFIYDDEIEPENIGMSFQEAQIELFYKGEDLYSFDDDGNVTQLYSSMSKSKFFVVEDFQKNADILFMSFPPIDKDLRRVIIKELQKYKDTDEFVKYDDAHLMWFHVAFSDKKKAIAKVVIGYHARYLAGLDYILDWTPEKSNNKVVISAVERIRSAAQNDADKFNTPYLNNVKRLWSKERYLTASKILEAACQ